jgi:glycosyltransferase involved in cell wall biosynthesis
VTQERQPQVLHLVASTRRRGAEVFATDLASALRSHGPSGRVISLTGGGTLPVDVTGSGRFHLRTLAIVRSEVRRSSVVVAHGSTTLLAACTATVGAGVPFVYRNIGDPDHWVGTRRRSQSVGLMLRRAARVVALWPGAAERLVERHRLDPQRVAVAPTGVDVARFPPVDEGSRAIARKSLHLEAGGPVVCVVGSLTSEKDPFSAIRAVARVDGARLLVAGEGPLRPALEEQARALLPGRATFLAAVDDVRLVLAAADVLLLSSRTEGLPAVLIEAGLSSLPVVATPVGGVAEIVEDGVTGVLAPVGDAEAMANAIDQALAAGRAMGERARARCERHFGLDQVAETWAAVLRAVIGEEPSTLDS